jgi:hypothetical protein
LLLLLLAVLLLLLCFQYGGSPPLQQMTPETINVQQERMEATC